MLAGYIKVLHHCIKELSFELWIKTCVRVGLRPLGFIPVLCVFLWIPISDFILARGFLAVVLGVTRWIFDPYFSFVYWGVRGCEIYLSKCELHLAIRAPHIIKEICSRYCSHAWYYSSNARRRRRCITDLRVPPWKIGQLTDLISPRGWSAS